MVRVEVNEAIFGLFEQSELFILSKEKKERNVKKKCTNVTNTLGYECL